MVQKLKNLFKKKPKPEMITVSKELADFQHAQAYSLSTTMGLGVYIAKGIIFNVLNEMLEDGLDTGLYNKYRDYALDILEKNGEIFNEQFYKQVVLEQQRHNRKNRG